MALFIGIMIHLDTIHKILLLFAKILFIATLFTLFALFIPTLVIIRTDVYQFFS